MYSQFRAVQQAGGDPDNVHAFPDALPEQVGTTTNNNTSCCLGWAGAEAEVMS